MLLRHVLGQNILRRSFGVWHETNRTLPAARRSLSRSRTRATLLERMSAPSTTPVLNAQGQPIRSALKADDDVARTPPSGPVKGEHIHLCLPVSLAVCCTVYCLPMLLSLLVRHGAAQVLTTQVSVFASASCTPSASMTLAHRTSVCSRRQHRLAV